jgi:hypothetical protein
MQHAKKYFNEQDFEEIILTKRIKENKRKRLLKIKRK